MIIRKSKREIQLMRNAGMVVAETIYALCKNAKPGITTRELGEIGADVIASYGGKSAFLHYQTPYTPTPYPGVVCISVNDEIVHGIPGDRKLKDGDIVSVDVGVLLEGYHGDAAGTVGVGKIPEKTRKLLEVTRQCLYNGIEKASPGNRIAQIGKAVQQTAEKNGFGVVRELVGHGVGRDLHEDPQVPNYFINGFSPLLKTGMTIAIEPMITMGHWQVKELSDGWTISTLDGSLSAHFEHSVAITENGPQILTLRENGKEGFDITSKSY